MYSCQAMQDVYNTQVIICILGNEDAYLNNMVSKTPTDERGIVKLEEVGHCLCALVHSNAPRLTLYT